MALKFLPRIFVLQVALFLLVFHPFYILADVVKVESFAAVSRKIDEVMKEKNAENVLAIISLERSLLMPANASFGQQEKNYQSLLKQAISKVPASKLRYLGELILTEYDQKLTDPSSKEFISNLQKQQIGTIIFTKNISGAFNKIPNLDEWTIKYLKDKGIDLELGIYQQNKITFQGFLKEIGGSYPTFYHGLLSCNSSGRDNTLQQVLLALLIENLRWMPEVMFVIHHDEGYLRFLEVELKKVKQDMEFFGFVYGEFEENLDEVESSVSPKEYLSFWSDIAEKLSKVKTNKMGRDK